LIVGGDAEPLQRNNKHPCFLADLCTLCTPGISDSKKIVGSHGIIKKHFAGGAGSEQLFSFTRAFGMNGYHFFISKWPCRYYVYK
ncbi:hypothetical protein, partial [Candidatus Symbiopectobacterium sp. NZEC135]|uniref:hypothetical protein n=1 Tax=Candidatus Symbiopectobacterium sp. NZEC135 TaxID=2820471 RepID=UPI002A070EA7|nr:hypothetical protein [Candidatus Symbiopectobacterium sp. NZEC135]